MIFVKSFLIGMNEGSPDLEEKKGVG